MNRFFTSSRRFGEIARLQFLKNLTNAPPSRHPRLVSDSDQNSTMSVLIPLVMVNGERSVLLTKRSIHLRSHRGEVCFPGGRRDDGESTEETALRETEEEIGLKSENIRIWGRLKSVLRRQADFVVTPIVGHIDDSKLLENLKVSDGEVQAVFSIPISELLQRASYTKFKSRQMKYTLPVFDSSRFTVFYNSPNEYLHHTQRVWGLSAVMLHQALAILCPDEYKYDIVIKFF